MEKPDQWKSCYTNSRTYSRSFGLLFLGSSMTESVTFTQRRQDLVFKHWMQWPLEEQMLSQAVCPTERFQEIQIFQASTLISLYFVCYRSSVFIQVPLGCFLFKSFCVWIILTKNWHFFKDMLPECNYSSYRWYKEVSRSNNLQRNYQSFSKTVANYDGWKHFRTLVFV